MLQIYSTTLKVISSILFFLFLYALLRHRNQYALIYSFISLTAGIYALGYSLELQASTPQEIRFYLSLEYLGIAFLPGFLFLFAYKFLVKKSISPLLGILFFAEPLLIFFLHLTNEYHHLFYAELRPLYRENQLVVQIIGGPFYFVHMGYMLSSLTLAVIVLIRKFLRSQGKLKNRYLFIGLGFLSPLISAVAYFSRLTPPGVDTGIAGVIGSALFFSIAVFRYHFFDIDAVILQDIFSALEEGVVVIDKDLHLMEFNPSASRYFPCLSTFDIGSPIPAVSPLQQLVSRQEERFTMELKVEEAFYILEVTAKPIFKNTQPCGKAYVMKDVTRTVTLMNKLEQLATTDQLTGLYNRRKLMEEGEKELQRCIRYGMGLSVFMIDIDHFKKVNDTYGHHAGDEVLKHVAGILSKGFRSIDIIGRYGGEEFIMILSGVEWQKAAEMGESLRELVERSPLVVDGNRIQVTLSIGSITVPAEEMKNRRNELNLQKLFILADQAMYEAKTLGRNRVISLEYQTG